MSFVQLAVQSRERAAIAIIIIALGWVISQLLLYARSNARDESLCMRCLGYLVTLV